MGFLPPLVILVAAMATATWFARRSLRHSDGKTAASVLGRNRAMSFLPALVASLGARYFFPSLGIDELAIIAGSGFLMVEPVKLLDVRACAGSTGRVRFAFARESGRLTGHHARAGGVAFLLITTSLLGIGAIDAGAVGPVMVAGLAVAAGGILRRQPCRIRDQAFVCCNRLIPFSTIAGWRWEGADGNVLVLMLLNDSIPGSRTASLRIPPEQKIVVARMVSELLPGRAVTSAGVDAARLGAR